MVTPADLFVTRTVSSLGFALCTGLKSSNKVPLSAVAKRLATTMADCPVVMSTSIPVLSAAGAGSVPIPSFLNHT